MSQDGIKTSEIPKEEVRQSSTDYRDVEELLAREWKINLKDFLSCPKCWDEPVRPSVTMCSNGHSVCLKCRTGRNKCPLCKEDFIKAKNPILSEMATLIKYPCINASNGCPVHYYLHDEASHLETCAYTLTTEHRCKFDPCPWVGKKEDLVAHVLSQHEGGTVVEKRGEMKINQDHSYEEVKLMVLRSDLCWMLTKSDTDEKKLYKCFQIIGTPEYAKQFHYQINFITDRNRLVVCFQGPVDDDTKGRDSAYESDNCMVVDFATLQTIRLCSDDKKIFYYHEIIKKPFSFEN